MLFGSGSAKFTRSGSEVILNYSNIRPNWSERNIKTVTNIHQHYNTYFLDGDYSSFIVDVDLSKELDSEGVFETLYGYLFKTVYFWPHKDGNAVSGSDGKPSPFFIRDMSHRYDTDTYVENDYISILFESTDYTLITGSLA